MEIGAEAPRSPDHPQAAMTPFSDVYNAEIFTAEHGANLRYCPAWGTWLLIGSLRRRSGQRRCLGLTIREKAIDYRGDLLTAYFWRR